MNRILTRSPSCERPPDFKSLLRIFAVSQVLEELLSDAMSVCGALLNANLCLDFNTFLVVSSEVVESNGAR